MSASDNVSARKLASADMTGGPESAGGVLTYGGPDLPGNSHRSERWIDDWRPEDLAFWNGGGSKIARRNLVVSIFTEHIGFSIWSLWSVLVLFLTPRYGISVVPSTAAAEKFTLITLPTALGAFVRLPYTFAVAKFGGRNWTIVSAAMLFVPTVATLIVLKPGVSYHTLLVVSALAGVGGGNFASSMTNINSFYPNRLKGTALGLNAGGGNLGVAAVQLVGLAVLATAGKSHPRVVVAIYLPLILIGVLSAFFLMNNLSIVRNEKRAMRDVCRDRHTWVMSAIYIGTFGSFIGFGFAFGQVLSTQFPSHFWADKLVNGKHVVDPVQVAYLTFLGPLIGSLIRPLGGMLADRFGGARTTFWNFVAMALSALIVFFASQMDSLPLFMVGFLALFFFSGIGNGSAYKMIPAIFRSKAQLQVAAGVDTAVADHDARRFSNALIGIAGAIGAFGGVLVNIAFRQSFLSNKTGDAAYIGFLVYYAFCVFLTWSVYLRRSKTTLAGI
jgi:NNP family nitrate/nitrite transporter-like MFS transporter